MSGLPFWLIAGAQPIGDKNILPLADQAFAVAAEHLQINPLTLQFASNWEKE